MKLRLLYLFPILMLLLGCAHKSWDKIDLSVNSDAKIISTDPVPKYPAQAMAEKKTGNVKITFVVDEFGNPEEIKIVKETPEGFGFGPAAVKQASKLKFMPAVNNGKRVKQRFVRTYTFDDDSHQNNLNQEYKSIDLNNCADPLLSSWASEVKKSAYAISDSISRLDTSYNAKCSVHFIVNQRGEIFNLEKGDCELGFSVVQKMKGTVRAHRRHSLSTSWTLAIRLFPPSKDGKNALEESVYDGSEVRVYQ